MPGKAPSLGVVDQALAKNRLGIASVVFFVVAAAAPLTVIAGGAGSRPSPSLRNTAIPVGLPGDGRHSRGIHCRLCDDCTGTS